ncbi:GbpC/Spa domain-containing protein, partial [Streptococcus ovis]
AFNSEPGANIKSVQGPVKAIKASALTAYQNTGKSLTDSAAFLSYIAANYSTSVTDWGSADGSNFLWVDKKDQFYVTYSGLSNSRFGNSVLGSVRYGYNLLSASGGDNAIFELYSDPTRTLFVYGTPKNKGNDTADDLAVSMTVQLFDKDGKEIVPSKDNPVAVNFGSLNNKTSPVIDYSNVEWVAYGNGKFVPITGSSVTDHNGIIYADQNNSYVDGTATSAKYFSAGDEKDSTRYYGAGVGIYTSPISFQFGATNRDITSTTNGGRTEPTNIWFAFNTNVVGDVPVVPEKPVEPDLPALATPKPAELTLTLEEYQVETPEVELIKYQVNAPKINLTKYKVETPTVHYNYHTLKQSPKIVKQVQNSDGVDVDNKMVPKNSDNKYPLVLPTIKAGRPAYKQDQIVIEDYLPSGFKLDLDQTVDA